MTSKHRRLARALLLLALLASGTAVLAGTARADLVGDVSSTTGPVPIPDPSPLPVLSPLPLPVLGEPSPSPSPAAPAGATAGPSPSASTSTTPAPAPSPSPDASSSPSPTPTATGPEPELTTGDRQDGAASTGTGGSTSNAPTSVGAEQVAAPSSGPSTAAEGPVTGEPAPLRPAGGLLANDVPATRLGGSEASRAGGVAVPTSLRMPVASGWLQRFLTPSDLLSAPSLLTLPGLQALPGLQPTTGTWLPSLMTPGAPPVVAWNGSPLPPGSTGTPLVSAGREGPLQRGHPVGAAIFALGAVVAAAGVAQFRRRGLR